MLSSTQIAGFLNQPFLQNKSMKQPHLLHVDTNSQKSKVHCNCFGWAWSKMGVANLVSGLKTSVSQERKVGINWFFECLHEVVEIFRLSMVKNGCEQCAPSFFLLNLLLNFLNGGLDRILNFRGRLLGKTGVTIFGGLAVFIKNKLKSEIFNGKEVYKQKCFSLL